jgi:hypothetical protein
MKLLHLTVRNFRGAPDGTYPFGHPSTGKPQDRILITGGPASGKTSLLGAIAALKEFVGGYGPPPDPARLRRAGATEGTIAAAWLLTDEEAARAGVAGTTCTTEVSLENGPAPLFDPGLRALFGSYSLEPTRGKFELFPANRRLSLDPVPTRLPSSDLGAARLRLSTSPGKYAGVRQTLIELALADAMHAAESLAAKGLVTRWEQRDSLAPVKRSLPALAPWLRLTSVRPRDGVYCVQLQRADGAEIELEDLSESEQQALLFCVVFDRLGLNHSVVLIDQPELFIHPDQQAHFLRALEGLGVDNQIVAATSSAELLAAASAQQIVRLGPKAK